MSKYKNTFFIIVLIVTAMVYITFFSIDMPIGNQTLSIKGINQMRYGIDIRGGVEAIYRPKDLDRNPTVEELEAARAILETRLDAKTYQTEKLQPTPQRNNFATLSLEV